MDLKLVKDLIRLLDKKGLSRIRIKEGEKEIELERSLNGPTHHFSPEALSVPHQVVEAPKEKTETDNGLYITSPMVGTFYRTPSPDDPPFVKVGDTVTPDTVVCIIEAMKVMNEVKAGVSGKIEEILIDNGHPVEFGTKLFRLSS